MGQKYGSVTETRNICRSGSVDVVVRVVVLHLNYFRLYAIDELTTSDNCCLTPANSLSFVCKVLRVLPNTAQDTANKFLLSSLLPFLETFSLSLSRDRDATTNVKRRNIFGCQFPDNQNSHQCGRHGIESRARANKILREDLRRSLSSPQRTAK